ncbi:MAG: hypothetical protein ACSHX0_02875 [Akkermansiaceae bacterium]
MRNIISLTLILLASSCSQTVEQEAPIYYTPIDAQIDLSEVSMNVTKAQISKTIKNSKDVYTLSFDYEIINSSGQSIAFACLQNKMNTLLDVYLANAEGTSIPLIINPLDALTLAEAKPMIIKAGAITRSYSCDIMPSLIETGTPITLTIKLHLPSRYDELRSSLEPPSSQLTWP